MKESDYRTMEFGSAMMHLLPIMKNPFKSKEAKRKALNDTVNKLSQETFHCYPMQIIEVINKGEGVCKEYEDTEAQVNGVLMWLPRMKEHRELLHEAIKLRRKEYGLKI